MTPWNVDPVKRGIRRHVYFEEPSGNITTIIEVGPIEDDGLRRNEFADRLAKTLNDAGVVP